MPFTEVLKDGRKKRLEKGQEFLILKVCEASKGDIQETVGSVGVKLRREVWEEHKCGGLWHIVGFESLGNMEDLWGKEKV